MNIDRLLCSALGLALTVFVASTALAVDMNKTLHYGFEAAETGFDPAAYADQYSNYVMSNIIDSLLTYDYLARPAKLVPNTADMPEVRDQGKTYIFHLKKGIYFADDPAFGGKKRELTANDYIYSMQRLVDPTTKRPNAFVLRGKIIGLDEKVDKAAKDGKFDPATPVEGLKALDRYTLQISLKQPDYNLPYILAMVTTGAMAREVVDKYGQDIDAHPVGTGPYRLVEWQRAHKMVLEYNPNFRGVTYTPSAGAQGVDARVAKELAGKVLPQIGRVEILVIESAQSQYLGFLNGETDIHIRLGGEYAQMAVPGGVLDAKLAARGIRAYREAEPDITYDHFNMDDPVVGGYTPEHIALRRAIGMASNHALEAAVLVSGQALAAQGPWAPGIVGYDASYINALGQFDPARANAMLDVYGYRIDPATGYRTQPGGKPLVVTYLGATSGGRRDADELTKKSFDLIHVRMKIENTNFPDLVKRRQNGAYQYAGNAWGADYPDVENFLQLLYGPNKGEGNDARFNLPEFNRLYKEIATSPDSPERQAKVMRAVRLVEAYAPWNIELHRIRTHLAHGWVTGYLQHPIDHPRFMYYDIDPAKRDAYLQQKH